MNLEITVKTNLKKSFIDFIEVKNDLGETITLDWDESGITWTEEGFTAGYKGVRFNKESANGRCKELENAEIKAIQFYSEDPHECKELQISAMTFFDTTKWESTCLEFISDMPLDILPLMIREA